GDHEENVVKRDAPFDKTDDDEEARSESGRTTTSSSSTLVLAPRIALGLVWVLGGMNTLS
ncbi:unnamed protein product, partial [Amoebophrya sp. A25]